MRPIFIVSQPRSGSTLLQRILANAPQVASSSEPWVGIPLFKPVSEGNRQGPDRDYVLAGRAMRDNWEDRDQLLALLGKWLLEYYTRQAPEAEWFLDKTPRYYKILPELHRALPEARFIILKRHPADVARSIVTTWNNSDLIRFSKVHHDDLVEAPRLLHRFARAEAGERVRCVHYEELVQEPEATVRGLFDWLGLPFEPEFMDPSRNRQIGLGMGDPLKAHKSKGVERKSFDRQDRLPKYWSAFRRGYLHHLGAEFLDSYGYPLEEPAGPTLAFRIFDGHRAGTASRDFYNLRHFVKFRMARLAASILY